MVMEFVTLLKWMDVTIQLHVTTMNSLQRMMGLVNTHLAATLDVLLHSPATTIQPQL
jgi:hypothetical protein